jgi:hypothetical protein
MDCRVKRGNDRGHSALSKNTLGCRCGRSDDILLSSLAFTNPISRASKAPNYPRRRIFERNICFKGHLRQLTEHAPAKSAARRGDDVGPPFSLHSILKRCPPSSARLSPTSQMMSMWPVSGERAPYLAALVRAPGAPIRPVRASGARLPYSPSFFLRCPNVRSRSALRRMKPAASR